MLGGTRRRKYCDDRCKRRYHRGAQADTGKQGTACEQPPGEGIESTEAATMLALAEAGKLGVPGGQAALVLARRIDRSHRDTGAGLASMVKRLQETVDALTEDVDRKSSALDRARDELSERRERRGA